MKRSALLALALALAAPLVGLSHARAQSPAPDTIFVNGKVFTADPRSSVVQAFAVKGERFIAAGTSSEMRKLAGPGTRIVDLKGRFVSPGLTDNHFHHEGGGPGVDLSRVRTMDELVAAIAKAAAAAGPDDVVVTNSDWHEAQLREQRTPTTADLDRASRDRAVVVVRGGHSIFLNSAALKRWNITKATPVPPGGAIQRTPDGELTGELVDNAKALVELPKEDPVSYADILKTQRTLHPYGITAVRIPGSYKGDSVQAYRLMQQARDRGELTLRYTVYMGGYGLRDGADVEGLIRSWNVKLDEGDDWVRVGGVKLIVDGGFEGGLMTKPYAEPYGQGGKFHGLRVVGVGPYQDIVNAFNRAGWRVTTHAVGDAGIDQVIQAYEAANAERSIAGRRWTIEHAFVARPDQFARLKRLDVGLSVQDHLYLAGPSLKKYWGAERAHHVTPMKSYLDAGLLVSGGTDAPVIPFNPLWAIYHFMTRDTISDGVYGPSERVVTRGDVLKVFTINYARMIGAEDRLGSIEAGKLADFAVFTDDLLTAPLPRVRDARALATYVGGKEVYRDPKF